MKGLSKIWKIDLGLESDFDRIQSLEIVFNFDFCVNFIINCYSLITWPVQFSSDFNFIFHNHGRILIFLSCSVVSPHSIPRVSPHRSKAVYCPSPTTSHTREHSMNWHSPSVRKLKSQWNSMLGIPDAKTSIAHSILKFMTTWPYLPKAIKMDKTEMKGFWILSFAWISPGQWVAVWVKKVTEWDLHWLRKPSRCSFLKWDQMMPLVSWLSTTKDIQSFPADRKTNLIQSLFLVN